MAFLQQLIDNIPIPDSQQTVQLTTFICRTLLVYTGTNNWKLHLARAEVIAIAKRVSAFFCYTILQQIYDDVYILKN
jgi:hypothetical protein